MSILSSVTSVLEPIKYLGIPSEECKPTKCDDRGDDKHKGREESKNDDHEKQTKNDDHRDDHDKEAKNDDHRDDREKQVKNDDHRDDHDKQAKNDDHRDDHDKQARNDDHRNDDHRNDHDKHAKNDDCQPHKDYCQPQKDHCDTKPSDDCGKGNTYHSPGEALAKCDFSHSDLSSQAPDHSDVHGALASMPCGHALDYAIGQMGSADHFDAGHFDIPAETLHDIGHHA